MDICLSLFEQTVFTQRRLYVIILMTSKQDEGLKKEMCKLKKIIKPETMYEFKMVGNPRYSPDGKYLSFTVSQMSEERDGYDCDIWLYGKNGPRRLTSRHDANGMVWTPENTIIFSAMREQKYKQMLKNGENVSCFYEISPEGGEARLAFTLPFRAGGLKPLGGGLYAFTARTDLGTNDNPAYDQFTELPFWSNAYASVVNGKRNVVYIYDRANDKCTRVSPEDWQSSFCEFKDGKVLYIGGPHGDNRTPHTGLYEFDIATGETKELIPWNKYEMRQAMHFGSRILFIGTLGTHEGGEKFWYYDPATGLDGMFLDYEYTKGSGGAATDIYWGGGQGMKLTDKGLYFLTIIDEHSHLRIMDFDGNLTEVPMRTDMIACFDLCGDHIASIQYLGNTPAELFVDMEKVTDFNKELVAEYDLRDPEEVFFTASDGYEIRGWVLPPPGYDPSKKYPALLDVHGGPRGAYTRVLDHERQVFAAAGYIVLYCNPRGSEGRGDEFADIWGKYFTVDYDNLMEFTDECIRRYPAIDVDRLGVTGGSYGGVMTNWIITHTDRFKAAVAQRSIASWIVFEHTSDIGPGFNLTSHLATTRDNAEYLWDISPLKYAANCVTPTMFIHSDCDFCCWYADAVSMFTALKMKGVDSKVVLYHGENHSMSHAGRPHNRVTRFYEITGWLDKYLQK